MDIIKNGPLIYFGDIFDLNHHLEMKDEEVGYGDEVVRVNLLPQSDFPPGKGTEFGSVQRGLREPQRLRCGVICNKPLFYPMDRFKKIDSTHHQGTCGSIKK